MYDLLHFSVYTRALPIINNVMCDYEKKLQTHWTWSWTHNLRPNCQMKFLPDTIGSRLYAYKRVDAWAKAHALLMLTVKLKFTSSAYITVDAPYSVTLQLSLQQTQLYLPHLFIILEEIKQQNDHFSREEVLHKENKRAKKNVTNNKIPTGVQAKQASSKRCADLPRHLSDRVFSSGADTLTVWW